ncbi:hypothetical protein L3i22_096540 [Actinoplanes sp. L3-i22]|nr:hypothetical protein L3i22_096540 [Actinoplanes sp. L3-i22]
MDAEALLDEFAVRLGGYLAGQGFEADEWTFRRFSEHRDALIVEFQQAKLWTDDEARFFVNVFLLLNPTWEHLQAETGRLLTRIGPVSPYEDSWRIVNEATMTHVLDAVVTQLDEVLPGLVGLLDRTELDSRLEEIFGGGAWRMRAWILAENGPSAELESLFAEQVRANPGVGEIADVIRGYAATKA